MKVWRMTRSRMTNLHLNNYPRSIISLIKGVPIVHKYSAYILKPNTSLKVFVSTASIEKGNMEGVKTNIIYLQICLITELYINK